MCMQATVARHVRTRRVGPARTSPILTGHRCPREYIAAASSWPARVLGGKGMHPRIRLGELGITEGTGHHRLSPVSRSGTLYTMEPRERYMVDCHTMSVALWHAPRSIPRDREATLGGSETSIEDVPSCYVLRRRRIARNRAGCSSIRPRQLDTSVHPWGTF